MAILIVDDDAGVRERLAQALRDAGDGWEVRQAGSTAEALAAARDADLECILLDYRLPDTDGLACLGELRRLRTEVPVIMVTGSGSEAVAVEAMKLGTAGSSRRTDHGAGTIPLLEPLLAAFERDPDAWMTSPA